MKVLRILLLLLVFFCENNIYAQIPAPNLKCVRRDTLIWDTPTVSCGAVSAYVIYAARNVNGPYQVLSRITNLSQTRFYHNNTEGGTYYYFMQTEAACSGQTPRTSDTLDNLPPTLTPVSTLNVIDAKTVEVRWRRNPSPEVVGYIVYKKTTSGLIPIANIPSRDTLRYLDANASPLTKNEEYQVLSVDACGNTSLFDINHKTILTKVRQSKCDQTITISWNLYENWSNPIAKHEIWLSTNGRNPILYTSVGAKDTSFTFKDVRDKVRYSFYVKAVQTITNISAKSNDTAIVADILQPVKELVLENLSVNAKNQVDLTWRWNIDAKIDSVIILRAESDSTPYARVGGLKPTLPVDFTGTFADPSVNATTKQYFYKIQTKDQCGAYRVSNFGGTIYLRGYPDAGRRNGLKWTPFRLEGVERLGYELERIVDGASTLLTTPLLDTAATATTDLAQPDEPRVCYRVTAVFNNILSDGTRIETRSQSNITCVEQFSGIYTPNAFTPGGLNPEFKPVLSFAENIKSYNMLIFDRWGGKIFESTTPSVGWDGKRNGTDMPQGTYSYIIRIVQAAGGIVENKGVLVLLR